MKTIGMLLVVALVAVVVALFAWAVAKLQNASQPGRRPVVGNINRKFFRAHMRKMYLAPLLMHRFAAWLGLAREPHGRIEFANVGEGSAGTGHKTYFGDATTSSRYLLYKIGSDGDHVAITGAGDVPLGSSDDAVADVTVPISINLLGVSPGTMRVVSDGTIANGDHVKAGATGMVTKASTTDVSFGIALIGSDTTAASGDVITIMHCVPHKYVF